MAVRRILALRLGSRIRILCRIVRVALYQAQQGVFPDIAQPLKGFGSAEVVELRENDKGGTFRAMYTVRFSDAIIVLHVFQKKSKKGIETPKQDIDLIHSRLKLAE